MNESVVVKKEEAENDEEDILSFLQKKYFIWKPIKKRIGIKFWEWEEWVFLVKINKEQICIILYKKKNEKEWRGKNIPHEW